MNVVYIQLKGTTVTPATGRCWCSNVLWVVFFFHPVFQDVRFEAQPRLWGESADSQCLHPYLVIFGVHLTQWRACSFWSKWLFQGQKKKANRMHKNAPKLKELKQNKKKDTKQNKKPGFGRIGHTDWVYIQISVKPTSPQGGSKHPTVKAVRSLSKHTRWNTEATHNNADGTWWTRPYDRTACRFAQQDGRVLLTPYKRTRACEHKLNHTHSS